MKTETNMQINDLQLGKIEAAEILKNLISRKTVIFDDLEIEEKIAINHKELVEDDYFLVLSHPDKSERIEIDKLCPLNFFVNNDFELVAYCEDNAKLSAKLPHDTKIIFNRI